MNNFNDVSNIMKGNVSFLEEELPLRLPKIDLIVRSNSKPVLDTLRHYFRHLPHAVGADAIEVIVVEQTPLQLDLPWRDWKREQTKTGRKDAYIEGDGYRLIHKVRTGMMFLQSASQRIATGSCEANCNQVINFIINQQMTALQQQGWLICHASAVTRDGKALALAGFSGGGKSTLALHLMAHETWKFVSNDRLFVHNDGSGVQAIGVPKLPRVNPGTLLHNPQLRDILSATRIAELEQMPVDALWNLEEKYDVDVVDQYGSKRIAHEAKLAHFMVLNWSHDTDQPTSISRIKLDQQPRFLDAIMKSSGPFYQQSNGNFLSDDTPLPRAAYHDLLSDVDLLEVQGRVDFDHLCHFCDTTLVK